MGVKITAKNSSFASSIPKFYNDYAQTAGSLVILSFDRADCWNGGNIVNLAGDTAAALVTGSNRLDPSKTGTLENIRYQANAVGFGAEQAGLKFPSPLVDYMKNRNIAISIFCNPNAMGVQSIVGLYNEEYDFPAAYSFVLANTDSSFEFPYGVDYVPGKICHIATSMSGSSINGAFDPATRGLTATHVPTSPTTKSLIIRPDAWSNSELYQGPADGAVPQNLTGKYVELYRFHIEDLTVSGRTFNEFVKTERDYFVQYHPNNTLLT